MKGKYKKRATAFEKGHPLFKGMKTIPDEGQDTHQMKSILRVSKEDFSLVAKVGPDGHSITAPDCEGRPGSTMLLRPLSTATEEENSAARETSHDGNIIVNITKMCEVISHITKLHTTSSKQCTHPCIQVKKQIKVGLAWKFTFKCSECELTTPQYKLYKEIIESSRPGPNPADVNIGCSVGLMDTPVGNSRARSLMMSMNIPAPSMTSMGRNSNRVGKTVAKLNKQDMAEKIKTIKEVNSKRGNPRDEVNIAVDGRYNSTTLTSRKKPGQNASQAIGLAVENVTDHKFIIAAAFQNKLCWKGTWLRSKGFKVSCGDGDDRHEECTANLRSFEPLSEFSLGEDIGQQLSIEGLLIKHVTTDGDSRAAAGVEKALQVLHPTLSVTRLADPTHVGQAQFRKCNQAKFSQEMFVCKTRSESKNQQKVLSQDVKARCSLILDSLMKTYAGDMQALKSFLPRVLDATIRCYSGDCSKCARYAVVCSGGITKNWWLRSMFLASHRISQFNMNENDKDLLCEILKMKLGVDVVQKMKLYTNTQKVEAANRSLSVSLPKNVNFSRNMEARAHSTIHRLNNGPGTSTVTKCQTVGLELSPHVKRSLKQMDNETVYNRQYQTRSSVCKRKLLQHGAKIAEHIKYQQRSDKKVSDYSKHHLDVPSDHSDYTKQTC